MVDDLIIALLTMVLFVVGYLFLMMSKLEHVQLADKKCYDLCPECMAKLREFLEGDFTAYDETEASISKAIKDIEKGFREEWQRLIDGNVSEK